MLKIPRGMRCAHIHRNSLPLICSPSLPLSRTLPTHSARSHARSANARRRCKTHTQTPHAHNTKHTVCFPPPLAQEKTLLARALRRFSVHWPLVVNNDMTHPVERPLFCVSLMGADRRARSPVTWVSPPPGRRTADLSATANSRLCLLSFVTTVF